jgi:hypothetical protein
MGGRFSRDNIGAGNKRKIELTGKDGSIFELVIDDGDY